MTLALFRSMILEIQSGLNTLAFKKSSTDTLLIRLSLISRLKSAGAEVGLGLELVSLAMCALSCEAITLGSSTGGELRVLRVGGNTFPF